MTVLCYKISPPLTVSDFSDWQVYPCWNDGWVGFKHTDRKLRGKLPYGYANNYKFVAVSILCYFFHNQIILKRCFTTLIPFVAARKGWQIRWQSEHTQKMFEKLRQKICRKRWRRTHLRSSVTRYWSKKQPKCFQKLPQKVAKVVLPKSEVFKHKPKKSPYNMATFWRYLDTKNF